MAEFIFETNGKTWEYCTKVFRVKGTISSDMRAAVGVSSNWNEPYQYTVSEGFPIDFNEISTSSYPILQITVKNMFNNSLATINDHI